MEESDALNTKTIRIVGEMHTLETFRQLFYTRHIFRQFLLYRREHGGIPDELLLLMRKTLMKYCWAIKRNTDWFMKEYRLFKPDIIFHEIPPRGDEQEEPDVRFRKYVNSIIDFWYLYYVAGKFVPSSAERSLKDEDPDFYDAILKVHASLRAYLRGPFSKLKHFQNTKTMALYDAQKSQPMGELRNKEKKNRAPNEWEKRAFDNLIQKMGALEPDVRRVMVVVGTNHASVFERMFKQEGADVICHKTPPKITKKLCPHLEKIFKLAYPCMRCVPNTERAKLDLYDAFEDILGKDLADELMNA